MDYREQSFRDKFADAAVLLNMAPQQLASLKLRENVGGYREYHDLLHALEHEAGVRSSIVQGNFRGTAYLVEKSNSRIIIVEHETGLEILYVAGSIASLLGLIPLVLRCWSVIRNDGRHRPPHFRDVEIRRLGEDGHLIEERSAGLDVPWASPLSTMNSVLMSAAETIDIEIQRLRVAVAETTKRIDSLESTIVKKTAMKKRTTKQVVAKRPRKSS